MTIFNKTAFVTLLSVVTAVTSCSKYTELDPVNSPSESTAFESASSIELAMQGVYESAAVGTYNGSKSSARGYPFGAASIEQAEMRGEDMLNRQTFYQITYEATYTTTTANNVNMWSNLYALINQCNVMIAGLEGAVTSGVLTAEEAAAYEGESRFLRALAHHELVINFSFPYADGNGSKAGVPYREVAITSEDAINEQLSVGRGTVAEDYTKILEDLDYAENNLPVTQDKGYSRATKGAAIALKTRIKLHMQDWDGVITEGAKLGTDLPVSGHFTSPIGSYTLTDDPETPFTSYESNTESIFSIANGPSANGGTNGALPAMWGPASLGGRGLIVTSPILYNASFWVAGDLRRTKLQVLQTTSGATYYFNYKFRDYTNKADWAPIIRYAEVLLNVAEAYARNGNNAQALLLLNDVRDRSVPDASEFTTAPADMIQAILNERRVEFAGEGRRWPDIHRLALDATYGTGGIPAKLLNAQLKKDGTDYNYITPPTFSGTGVPAYSYSNYRFLWPIPSDEIAANPTLAAQQNAGY